VRFGGLIWLAGHVSADPALGVRGQTGAILSRIDARLGELGSDRTRILMANVWLADIATFEEMNAAWDAWVDPAHLPARATVEAKLASPNYLVEIAVVAAAGDAR
jgi:enamine deaminase RidA (YjgF/YER057c/UK114 family)